MKYLVATEVGGIMEQPHFTYENIQTIEADSESEAVQIYNKTNNCNYFYGIVIGNEKTGRTRFDEPKKQNSFN